MLGRRKTKGERQKIDKRAKNLMFFVSMIVVLFIASCQDVKKPEKPEDLISKEKMIDILYDVYLTNAARSVNNKLLRKTGKRLDSLIYAKYHIDSIQFVNSNAYYSADLKVYSKIISTVKDRFSDLKTEKDSIYKIVKEHKEDSVSKLNKKFKEKNKKSIKKDSTNKLVAPVTSF